MTGERRMRKEVEMGAHRVLAAMAMLLLSGLCAAGQGLRVQPDDVPGPAELAGLHGRWAESERFSVANAPLGAKGDRMPRFGARSAGSDLGLVQPLPGGWATRFDLAAVEREYAMPRYSLLAQLGKELGGGWGMSVGVQHSRFSAANLGLGAFTVAGYYGNQQLSYTVYSARPEERGMALSQRVQWSYYVGDRGFFGLSLGQGLGVESAAPEPLSSGYVRNVTLFGRYWFLPDWAVSAEAETQEQVGQSRRNDVRFGLRHQF
jgi:YaiO family outer membrane protein